MVKLVICSDTHLNAYYARMRPEQLEKRRERLRQAFQKVVDFAIEEKVDVFLHAGDLFDMPDPRYKEVILTFRELKRLKEAGIRTYLIGGTHDIPKAIYEAGGAPVLHLYEEAGLAKFFRFFHTSEAEVIDVNGKRLVIAGVSCDPRIRDGNPLESLNHTPAEGDFRIFMFHYAIEGKMPRMYEGAFVPLSCLRDLPADIIVAGHIHPHSHFELGNKLVIIPGATERLDFGEEENETGFYYVELENKPKIKYLKIEPQRMRTVELHISELANQPEEKKAEYIISKLKSFSHPDQLLRFRLKGQIKPAHSSPGTKPPFTQFIPLNRIVEEGNNNNFYFHLDLSELKIESSLIETYGGEGNISIFEEVEKVVNSMLEREDETMKKLIQEARHIVLSRLEEVR
ncbi:DNA repair exonuclease [bacterium]|nr:DNA repair exonuclease [bacterium]